MEVSPLRALTLDHFHNTIHCCIRRNGSKPVEGIDTSKSTWFCFSHNSRNGSKPVEGIDTPLSLNKGIWKYFCRNGSKPVEGIDTLLLLTTLLLSRRRNGSKPVEGIDT